MKYDADRCHGQDHIDKKGSTANVPKVSLLDDDEKRRGDIQYSVVYDSQMAHELFNIDFKKIYNESLKFVKVRGWGDIDRPSSLCSALYSEIGELS